MDNEKKKFPGLKKTIDDFIEDDDGNITRDRLVSVGAMVMVMGILMGMSADAGHGSHQSHSSVSYIRGHSDHSDHGSHTSHDSHTSHSNTASHSNSLYSAEGDVSYGPSVSSIPSVQATPKASTGSGSTSTAAMIGSSDVKLPQIPQVTPDGKITVGSITHNVKLPEIPTAPDVPDTIQPGSFSIPNMASPVVAKPFTEEAGGVASASATTDSSSGETK